MVTIRKGVVTSRKSVISSSKTVMYSRKSANSSRKSVNSSRKSVNSSRKKEPKRRSVPLLVPKSGELVLWLPAGKELLPAGNQSLAAVKLL